MKQYIITEERLLELLEAETKLQCLEQDGVDNWTWYMEGRERFIAMALDISEEEVEEKELDFEDVAREELADFYKYKDSDDSNIRCDNCKHYRKSICGEYSYCGNSSKPLGGSPMPYWANCIHHEPKEEEK